jgi:putative ABC transport system permease protein
MSVTQSFLLAMKNLMLSKMRSLLTMLGIIIGVASVIVIISLGDGVTGYVNEQFESMGSNLIMVFVDPRSTSRRVTDTDMYALVEENRANLDAVSPLVTANAAVKYRADAYTSTGVVGVGEAYDRIGSLTVTEGRFLQYLDIERQQKVCVVGAYVAREILNNEAIGKPISLSGNTYTVVGVLEEKAGSYKGGDDDKIYIPYTSAARLNGATAISTYYFSAVGDGTMDLGQWAIETKLQKIYQDEDAYMVMNMAEIMSMMDAVTGMLVTVLVAIAAISLVVGGIGIMNIMLVTVTERTREIGIRKSLGAKRRDIRTQFIIEAGATSAVGGIFGIVVGAVLSGSVGSMLGLSANAGLQAIGVAFGVSVAIGVVFGYLPANKAAKLNPIDALRYE